MYHLYCCPLYRLYCCLLYRLYCYLLHCLMAGPMSQGGTCVWLAE